MQNEFDKQSSLESTSEVLGCFTHTHTHFKFKPSQAKPSQTISPQSLTLMQKKSQPSEAEATKKTTPQESPEQIRHSQSKLK
jgi:hypothetical protein